MENSPGWEVALFGLSHQISKYWLYPSLPGPALFEMVGCSIPCAVSRCLGQSPESAGHYRRIDALACIMNGHVRPFVCQDVGFHGFHKRGYPGRVSTLYIYIHTCVCMYIFIYIYMHMYRYVHLYIYIYVYLFLKICIYIYIYMVSTFNINLDDLD